MMFDTVSSSKQAAPVKGVCRWLGDKPCGRRVIAINGTVYEVEHGWNVLRLYRFDFSKPGTGLTVYTVDTSSVLSWRCDCPDAANRDRPGGCKHVKALRAAVAKRPY